MTATFDISLSTAKDKVRARIGDVRGLSGTTVTKPLLQDETIAAVLVWQTNANLAAAECAEMCMALYAHQPSTTDMDLQLGAERFQFLKDTADRLRAQDEKNAGNRASFDVGGITTAERDTLSQDSGAVQPKFIKGQDDYPGTTEDTGVVTYVPTGI